MESVLYVAITISVSGFWNPILCMVGASSCTREFENQRFSSHVMSMSFFFDLVCLYFRFGL